MSRTARQVPRTLPVTFERPPTRGPYETAASDAPPRRGGAEHHLERPAEAAVAQTQLEQRLARAARIGPRSVSVTP